MLMASSFAGMGFGNAVSGLIPFQFYAIDPFIHSGSAFVPWTLLPNQLPGQILFWSGLLRRPCPHSAWPFGRLHCASRFPFHNNCRPEKTSWSQPIAWIRFGGENLIFFFINNLFSILEHCKTRNYWQFIGRPIAFVYFWFWLSKWPQANGLWPSRCWQIGKCCAQFIPFKSDFPTRNWLRFGGLNLWEVGKINNI